MSVLTADSRYALGDGSTMPCIGFGTYQIKDEDCQSPVEEALKLGYRHIDTAEIYKNESACGRALVASGVAREDVYITTKLWPGNPAWGMEPKTFESTIDSCRASLTKLGVEKVDLYLIHTPLGGGPECRLAQYRGLVECQRLGMCGSIGVSNYGIAHLQEIEAAGLPAPAANQIELHPFCQKREILAYMREKGILPIAYSSLAPLSTWRSGQQSAKTDVAREAASPIAAIAGRHDGVSEAQCLLRYALQKGWCILPKSINQERIRTNLNSCSLALTEADMAELDSLDRDEALAFGSPGAPMDPSKCD